MQADEQFGRLHHWLPESHDAQIGITRFVASEHPAVPVKGRLGGC